MSSGPQLFRQSPSVSWAFWVLESPSVLEKVTFSLNLGKESDGWDSTLRSLLAVFLRFKLRSLAFLAVTFGLNRSVLRTDISWCDVSIVRRVSWWPIPRNFHHVFINFYSVTFQERTNPSVHFRVSVVNIVIWNQLLLSQKAIDKVYFSFHYRVLSLEWEINKLKRILLWTRILMTNLIRIVMTFWEKMIFLDLKSTNLNSLQS